MTNRIRNSVTKKYLYTFVGELAFEIVAGEESREPFEYKKDQ